MKLRRYGQAIAAIILLVVALGQPPSYGAPAEKTLTVGLSIDPNTLDPSQQATADMQSVIGHIHDQLVVFEKGKSEVKPWLATSWRWTDSTTLEMNLRRGVTFSNGEPFNGESVRVTLDAFAASPLFRQILPAGVYRETQVVNESTVRIRLTRPYGPFLVALARSVAVVPPVYYRSVGVPGYGLKPVGTGPYMLSEWVRGSHIVLTRNPRWWKGRVPLARMVFRVIPDETARVTAVETGEVDLAVQLPVGAIQRLRGNDRLNLIIARGQRKFISTLDTKYAGKSPLDDPKVRIALNMAVNKTAISRNLFLGTAEPLAGQWMTEGEFGHNPAIKAYPYDPRQARRLLAEAGYPQGFELQFTYTVGRYAFDKLLGEVVSTYLAQIGVKVKQRPVEFGAFVNAWVQRTVGTFQSGLLFPPDPHFWFVSYAKNGVNEFHDLGPDYARLVEEGVAEVDPAKREAIYKRLAEIMYANPPFIFLHVTRDIYAVNKRVKGFTATPDQVLWLHDIDVTN